MDHSLCDAAQADTQRTLDRISAAVVATSSRPPAVPYRLFTALDVQSFVRNDRNLRFAIIRSQAEWDGSFGAAAIMCSSRPFAPDSRLYDTSELLVINNLAPSLPTPADYSVESVTQSASQLVVRYRFTPPAGPTGAWFNSWIAIVVPRGAQTSVRFENVAAAPGTSPDVITTGP